MACFPQNFQDKAVKGRQRVKFISALSVKKGDTFSCMGTFFAHLQRSCHYYFLRNIYSTLVIVGRAGQQR